MTNPVEEYYDKHAEQEQNRLETSLSRVELASSLRLIDAYFPKNGKACDIGAATRRYSIELF